MKCRSFADAARKAWFLPAPANRRTQFLFYPSIEAMRADPRFGALVAEMGMTKYWAETKTKPDYKS